MEHDGFTCFRWRYSPRSAPGEVLLAAEKSFRRISLFVGDVKSESSIRAGVVRSFSLSWRDAMSQLRKENVSLKNDSARLIDGGYG